MLKCRGFCPQPFGMVSGAPTAVQAPSNMITYGYIYTKLGFNLTWVIALLVFAGGWGSLSAEGSGAAVAQGRAKNIVAGGQVRLDSHLGL